jgi:lipoate-protein ligase A
MPEAATHRELDLIVQPSIAPAVSVATDDYFLRTITHRDVTERRGVFRVSGASGEVISIGRYHAVPEAWAPTGSVSACRRLTGGRTLPFGSGFIGLSIVLPHRSALVSDDPLALAPQQVLNRCVRGMLKAFEDVGIPAFYPGRDLVTVDRRVLAAISFEVTPQRSLLFEALIANSTDFAAAKKRLAREEMQDTLRVAGWGNGEVTSIKEQLGVEISVEELADLLVQGYKRHFDLELRRPSEAPVAPVEETFSPETWLLARRIDRELDHHVTSAGLLGTFEAYFSLRASGEVDDIVLAGDFIASSGAVDELEAALRGCLLDRKAIDAVIARVFSKPENFILGIGPLSSITDLILSDPCSATGPQETPGVP